MAVSGGLSNAADMCNPKEDPGVCVLIEQRDNALADHARSERGRREEVAKRKDEAEYWRKYVAGDVDGNELKKHIEKICSYKGVQAEPIMKLCTWWDENYVPHAPVGKGPK